MTITTYIFCRMHVFMATYDHIKVDIESFLGGDHFKIIKDTLKDFPLKLVIISRKLGNKQNWV